MFKQQTPGAVQTMFGEMTEAQFREFRQTPMGFPTGQTAERYKEITGEDPVCNVDGLELAYLMVGVDIVDRLTSAIKDRRAVLEGLKRALEAMMQAGPTTQTTG